MPNTDWQGGAYTPARAIKNPMIRVRIFEQYLVSLGCSSVGFVRRPWIWSVFSSNFGIRSWRFISPPCSWCVCQERIPKHVQDRAQLTKAKIPCIYAPPLTDWLAWWLRPTRTPPAVFRRCLGRPNYLCTGGTLGREASRRSDPCVDDTGGGGEALCTYLPTCHALATKW
jgi:hypothetical protein